MIEDLKKSSPCFAQRRNYLDVFACAFLGASKNVPAATRRGAQKQASRLREPAIFVAEWPSTRANEVLVRAAGNSCCAMDYSSFSNLNSLNHGPYKNEIKARIEGV
jgi:hypothetical protein